MREIRISIATIVTILICFGVVMIYSASGVYALKELGDSTYFLKRHLISLGMSLPFILAVMAMDYRDLKKGAKLLMLTALVMLFLLLVRGISKPVFGAR